MSNKHHYQVQYVEKDKDKEPGHKRDYGYYNRGANKEQYSKKQFKYPRRNSNEKKLRIEYEQKQINEPEDHVYDAQSLLSHFKLENEPPKQIAELLLKVPHLFTSKPQPPVSLEQNKQNDSEDEPDWMKSNDFNENFEIVDIQSDLDIKRAEYQKKHGTFEKKQEEKRVKEVKQNEKNDQVSELEIIKQKYRQQMEEQGKEKQKQIETQIQLQQLFTMQLNIENPQKQVTKANVLTVEEIERQQLQSTQQLQKSQNQSTQQAQQAQQQQQVQQFIQQLQLTPQPQQPQQSQSQPQRIQVQAQATYNNSDSDDDLEQILGLKVGESNYQPQPPPNQRLIPLEKIKKNPFSAQAILHQRNQSEAVWFYIDRHQNLQGGFSSKDMDIWYQQGYLMTELRISWAQPGKWILLDQFLQNLELVSQGVLGQLKAMDPPDDVPAFAPFQARPTQQMIQAQQYQLWLQQQQQQLYQQQLQQQQQQQQFQKQQTQYRNNNNNNKQYQHQKQQQYYHNNNSNNSNTSSNNSYQQSNYQSQYQQKPKPTQQVQNTNTIFQIGQTKKDHSHSQSYSEHSTNGFTLDSKDFPSLGLN